MNKTAATALTLRTLARYLLGFGILPYGISKLVDLQFQVSAWDYARPLGDADGTILTWAFLGYSPWFQFLLGVFETVPGLLLLSRRTSRLGALLLFPVLLNVALMNFAMNLWPSTKLISAVLLFLNVCLLAFDLPQYASFLRTLIARPEPVLTGRWRLAGYALAFTVPALAGASFLSDFRAQVTQKLTPLTDFIGERQINRAGTWSIERLDVSGLDRTANPHNILYFDFKGRCHLASSDGSLQQPLPAGHFVADRSHRTFEISGIWLGDSFENTRGTYALRGDQMILDGLRDGQSLHLVLRRLNWGPHAAPRLHRPTP